jgi:subtilisin family serine protease
VAASNISKTLACFSNAGEVAAPGGDGERPGCRQVIDQCARIEKTRAADGGCPFALLSLSLVSNTGYAYWNGTSFSAPLVSGLAALILEAEGDAVSTDEIYVKIKDGAISGENVINVPYTLQ